MKSQRNRKRSKINRRRKISRRAKEGGNLVLRGSRFFPTDIKMCPIQTRSFRYIVSTALAAQQMTMGDLLKFLIWTTNASTTNYLMMETTRLKLISMYYSPGNDFDVSTNVLSFVWGTSNNSPSELITDRGNNVEPAVIKVRPPRGSMASMWIGQSSPNINDELCTFTAPLKTIIDFHVDYVLYDGTATSNTALSGVAATTGIAIYGLFSGHLTPDGGVTTYHS